jgi:hypothetical protein
MKKRIAASVAALFALWLACYAGVSSTPPIEPAPVRAAVPCTYGVR